jgi:MFS family permease
LYPFTPGIVLSSFFYGYIITQLPGGILAIKFGGRNLFGFGVFCTSVFTLLIPVAARWNVGILIALRILIGIFEVSGFDKLYQKRCFDVPVVVIVITQYCMHLLQ